MGASEFRVTANGSTAREAFNSAVSEAQWESGHGGYSGTIAEKHTFIMISPPENITPSAYANELLDAGDDRINDKWGPAGCIKMEKDKYLFFGLASS